MMIRRGILFPINNLRSVAKMSTVDKLLHPIEPRSEYRTLRVTVLGCGQVGMATAISLLTMGVSNDLVLIDSNENKVQAELMDLQHGSRFLQNAKITGGTDYALSKDSKVCIITMGMRQRPGETRLDLVNRNVDVMKQIVPHLVKYSPSATLVVATNPVDALTWLAWKISGLPHQRVIGSGTNLDSARFRHFISQRLCVAPTHVHGYIIGEHGDSSVPVWSTVNVAGVRLSELNPKIGSEEDKENWAEVHKDVVTSAYKIIKLKGYTSWAIGLSLAELTNSILLNTNTIHPVSILLKGHHCITKEVFLSLPCVLGHKGVTDVIKECLTKKELAQLHKGVDIMEGIQAGIKL